MKKLLKITGIILIGFLVIGIITLQFLKSDYYCGFDIDDLENFKDDIQSTELLSENFLEIYHKYHGKRNTVGVLVNRCIGNRECNCPSLELASSCYFLTNHNSKYLANSYILSLKLEKDFDQLQCLSYMLSEFYFRNNCNGIKQASQYYFDKSINDLSDKEIATLILMTVNPNYYDSLRYPERVEKQLSSLKF